MKSQKKVEDNVLIDSYKRHGNVWKVGEEVGLCGQSVHERIQRLGLGKPINVFTESEKEVLKAEYIKYRNQGNLQSLAEKMGRTKQFICRKASEMGLTDKKHYKPYLQVKSDKYFMFHNRLRKARGKPNCCEVCGKVGGGHFYEWANLTGKYEDILDYKRMCRHCHRQYDKERQLWDYKTEVKNGQQIEPACC